MVSLLSSPTSGRPGPSLDTNRVKALVLGDAGVGKTTLVQSLKGCPVKNPPWTIGCSVEVLAHNYQADTPSEAPYFVELWDIGGSRSHRNARRVFYQAVHGIILVHDLTNRKSEENLRQWLAEALQGSQPQPSLHSSGSNSRLPTSVFDSEQFATEKDIPILVVGSKAELLSNSKSTPSRNASKIASDCAADDIFLDCRQRISPGSTNGVKLAKFFDKMIERQHSDKKRLQSSSGLYDRRRRLQYQ